MEQTKAKLQSMVEKLDSIPTSALNLPEYDLLDSTKGRLWKLSVTMEDTKANLQSIAENLNRLYYEINLDVAQVAMLKYMELEIHELMQAEMFNEPAITCPPCLAAVRTWHGYLFTARELGGNLKKYLTLNLKGFMCYLGNSLRNIPPMYQNALLGLCGSYLLPPMQNNTAPFENSQLGKTKAPPLLLTFGEAFIAFNPEITHITKFLLCVILTAVLIFRLPHGVQIISMLILIATFFLGFLEMAHSASKTGVTCGSIHLPVFWFTTLSAVGISIIFGLFTIFVFYIIWRLSRGKPQANDDDVSLNDFVGDLEEGDLEEGN
ncbi:unnamed protein product [Trifolium pratense]|uniref:Uncharacterized protein n=1 Tax=Trifolium pratense TaxID=57577 RepID=A0ACB0IAQ0_TRIPR|nr:unnamed protein product [Trifolium pratense]